MFEIIGDTLTNNNYLDRLPAGVVLTGGSSQLTGLVESGAQHHGHAGPDRTADE